MTHEYNDTGRVRGCEAELYWVPPPGVSGAKQCEGPWRDWDYQQRAKSHHHDSRIEPVLGGQG